LKTIKFIASKLLADESDVVVAGFVVPEIIRLGLDGELHARLEALLVVGLSTGPESVREILLGGFPVPALLVGVPRAGRPKPFVHVACDTKKKRTALIDLLASDASWTFQGKMRLPPRR